MRDLKKESADHMRRWTEITLASQNHRKTERDRIKGRFEFESDEFMTSEEKAILYLKTGHVSPRY